MEELRERVRRGAALLDEHRPGWAAEIAPDRLAMQSCTACMLGQLYGHYWTGCARLAWELPTTFLFSAADHGFTIPDDQQNTVYEEQGEEAACALFAPLAEAWRDEIRARTAR